MSNKLPKPKASTQEHLDIDEINGDLVLLKTGWVALVMSTTAVNFDLLSEAEQDATIYAYGAFLNSLSFPVEILIRSKKADITAYFQSLAEAERSQPNPDLKRQIQKYQDFIQATVQQKTVLDKKFYLIINYSPVESGLGFGKKTENRKSRAQLAQAASVALAPRRDHVIKQTARLGLSTRQLNNQELIELFYDIYNPAPTGTQRILLDTNSYTTPMVEPAIENPEPATMTAPVALPVNAAPGVSAPTPTLPHLASAPVSQVQEVDQLRPAPPNVGGSAQSALPQVPQGGKENDVLKGLREATAAAAQVIGTTPNAYVGQQQSTPSLQQEGVK